MTPPLPRTVRFFRELGRRRVIHNVLAYVALSLLVIEASSNILPPLGISEDWVRVVIIVCIVGLAPVVAVSWIYELTEGRLVRTTAVEAGGAEPRRGRETGRDAGRVRHDRRHLAVLPFEDLSGDDRTYFADGIADDLTTLLAGVSELRVTSRTSTRAYRDTDLPLTEIADRLAVGSVLEGTVRCVGPRVRIVTRLVDTWDDRPLWSETYERDLEDILGLQADVARSIAGALEAELSTGSRDRLARVPTVDMTAYDTYLRGRFEWARRTESGLRASVAALESAVALDPEFAQAHAALAESLITLGLYGLEEPGAVMPRAREAARGALDRDPDNGEARASLACVRAIHEWDWRDAEEGFDRALEASPSHATAHQWKAMHLLAPLGRIDEARAALARAECFDPGSAAIRASRAFLDILERRPKAAEEAARAVLDAHPDFSLARLFLGEALLMAGASAEAVDEFERVVSVRGPASDAVAALARARAATGDTEGARALLADLEAAEASRYVSPSRIGEVMLALGDPEGAAARLAAAVDRRAVDLIWLAGSPGWAALRDHEAFTRARERLGV